MRKINLSRLGLLVVCCAAGAAIIANQSALAQMRTRQSPIASLVGSKRIRSSDPTFKYSAAVVLAPIEDRIIGHKIDMDMQGLFVWSETIHHTTSGDSEWFTRSIFWFSPDQRGKVHEMTAGQLAMAKTLFKEVNLSKAKNLTVGRNGISGSLTTKELGLKAGQLARMTRSRLAAEAKANQAAMGEIGQ
jgi:hypothetical protein